MPRPKNTGTPLTVRVSAQTHAALANLTALFVEFGVGSTKLNKGVVIEEAVAFLYRDMRKRALKSGIKTLEVDTKLPLYDSLVGVGSSD